MTHTEIIILNFEEIRRRSIRIWTALPKDNYSWKPDHKAMTCIEMIRHVLEGEHLFHKIVDNRGNIGDYPSPWKDRPYTTVQDELEFAKAYREQFLQAIQSFTPEDLTVVEIIRTEKGQRRSLGDYLQRIAYHEAVHAGQLLGYFRTLGLDRPQIWD